MKTRIEGGTFYVGNTGTNADSIITEALRRAKDPPPIQYALLSDAHVLWTTGHLAKHLLGHLREQDAEIARLQAALQERDETIASLQERVDSADANAFGANLFCGG